MPHVQNTDWLAPIEHEAVMLLVDLMRLGELVEATLTRDPETGAVRVRLSAIEGEDREGLLAFTELPLPG